MGCTALIHIKPNTRKTWDSNATNGYYHGTWREHYRCFKVWLKQTWSTWVTDIVYFKHQYITMWIYKGRCHHGSITRTYEGPEAGSTSTNWANQKGKTNGICMHLQPGSNNSAKLRGRKRQCHYHQQQHTTEGANTEKEKRDQCTNNTQDNSPTHHWTNTG